MMVGKTMCASCRMRLISAASGRLVTPLNLSLPGPSRLRPMHIQKSALSTSSSTNSPLRLAHPTSSYPVRRMIGKIARSLSSTSSRSYATAILPNSTPTATPTPLPRNRLKTTPPSLKAIRDEGFLDDDVSLVPEKEAYINVTQATIDQLERIASKEPPEVLDGRLALRVGVESGGCHGYQYTMALTEERGVDDYIMQPRDVRAIPIVVDLVSLKLLKGATLHHATELIGSSFQLLDNPQAKAGGSCGCGVSWEAKAGIEI